MNVNGQLWVYGWKSNVCCIFQPLETGTLEHYLSPREQATLAYLPTKRRRTEFITSRIAAKYIASRCLGGSPSQYQVGHHASGMPYLLSSGIKNPEVLSLSHADGLGGVVIGNRPVGIDLEFVDPENSQLRHYLCHQKESALIRRLKKNTVEQGWTETLLFVIKEAVLKTIGQALTIPRDQVILTGIHPLGNGLGLLDFTARFNDGQNRSRPVEGRVLRREHLLVGLAQLV
jgi:phosphopantetheinyl transferase